MSGDVDPKRRYERVLSVIAHQTTDKQHPGVRPRVIAQGLVAQGPYERDGIEASLRAADGADIVTWRDTAGHHRVTLRAEPDLQRAARYAGERELVDAVATLNQALAEVRDGE